MSEQTNTKEQLFSIIISIFNEEEGLFHFWNELKETLKKGNNAKFELIWVNDGSTDKTQMIINEIVNGSTLQNINHIKIEFSKNFGHESAMIAGIDNAQGDAIICIDSDGQHPTFEIFNMIEAFNEGCDIVLMNRLSREDNGFIKTQFSKLFYKIINKLSAIKFEKNATDFFFSIKRSSRCTSRKFQRSNTIYKRLYSGGRLF